MSSLIGSFQVSITFSESDFRADLKSALKIGTKIGSKSDSENCPYDLNEEKRCCNEAIIRMAPSTFKKDKNNCLDL